MAGLTVMVDHTATLREGMRSSEPDPVALALRAETGGADSIGVYLREDHRYIKERDVRLLRQAIRSRLVLHMAATSEMVGLALDIKPERVVLMPPLKDDGTVEAGLDLIVDSKLLYDTVDTLQSNNISVGVSIAPEPNQIKMAHQARANWIQIHAGRLKAADSATRQSRELNNIIDVVKMANRLRLHIAVGHGLDYRLIKLFAGLTEIDEFSLGLSIIARSLLVGVDRAVRDMAALIRAL